MRRSALAALGVVLSVTGCDSGQQQAQPAIKVRGPEQEQLHKLNDLNRAIALKRAIYDSGYQCQRITRSGYVAAYQNLDMWMASCADGRNWAVFIGPDGSAQVRDCGDVARFGLPECVVKAGQEPGRNAG